MPFLALSPAIFNGQRNADRCDSYTFICVYEGDGTTMEKARVFFSWLNSNTVKLVIVGGVAAVTFYVVVRAVSGPRGEYPNS